MKLFLTILSIAVVAQVSFGASIQRSKRDAESYNMYELTKNLVAEQKILVETVLQDVPATPAYSQHKQEWEDFLKTYDVTEEEEMCFQKMFRLMEGFSNFFPNYKSADASEEEKGMWQLFKKHGISEFMDKYEKIFANVNTDNLPFESFLEEC